MSHENKEITFNIGGMSWINCSLSIEKALSKLNGVTHATVNFAAEKAIIEYNPHFVDQKTIENTIAEAGSFLLVRLWTGESKVNSYANRFFEP